MSEHDEFTLKVEKILKNLQPAIKEMNAGICFMTGRHLLCALSGTYLITRVDPKLKAGCIERGEAEDLVLKNRSHESWVKVPLHSLCSEDELKKWLRVSIEYGKFAKTGLEDSQERVHRTIF